MKTGTYGIPYEGFEKTRANKRVRVDIIKKYNQYVRKLEDRIYSFDVESFFQAEKISTVFALVLFAVTIMYLGWHIR